MNLLHTLTKNIVSPQVTHVSALVLIALLTGGTLSSCAVKPHAITKTERTEQVGKDKGVLYAGQESVTAPIGLNDAIARALKYNLDNRLKMMEEALSLHQLDGANFNLLPKLTANAGYSTRDNELASSSNLAGATRLQTVPPSTSQDKSHTVSDLNLSWNILDFGVSYYQAKQQANQTLILQERRRKVVQTMTQQVRQAYWQAVGAQRLEGKITKIIGDAEQALKDSRTIESERLRSPLESLNYQRQMLDVLRQLEAIRDELAQAKPRLASIMNLPPSDDFKVAEPTLLELPVITAEIGKMEEMALISRPELMEASYNDRISVLETRKAVARLFPGIEFSASTNRDSNSYLVNNSWNAAGVRVGWNLFNLFNMGNVRRTAEAQLEVSRSQRLALHMAVLTQVNLANREYLSRKHQYTRTEEMFSVDKRILDFTRNAASSSSESRLQEIRSSAGALMSELRMYQSYGALQSAYGQVLATLGVDLLPKEIPDANLATLSNAVAKATQDADAAFGTVNEPIKAMK